MQSHTKDHDLLVPLFPTFVTAGAASDTNVGSGTLARHSGTERMGNRRLSGAISPASRSVASARHSNENSDPHRNGERDQRSMLHFAGQPP